MLDHHVLLVVDGYFSLGPQDRNDRSFSISHIIKTFKSSTSPKIFLDTAHRDGDVDATIWGKFDFAKSVPDLNRYDQIWLFGYNGPNKADPRNSKFKPRLSGHELLALARYMQNGGGVLATGDHEGLGSYMCGRIPRVRTMRKWYADFDKDDSIPADAPRNWPVSGPNRADTLQKDPEDKYHFTNQSDNMPQPLNLLNVSNHGIHEIFKLGPPGSQKPLQCSPTTSTKAKSSASTAYRSPNPGPSTDTLTFANETFTEYPTKASHQELPQIIATGSVIGGHATLFEKGKLCESGFEPDDSVTEAKTINTLAVYDGHGVGVGRVLTDSSFHHFCDLNLIGDPCAVGEKTMGFEEGVFGGDGGVVR